VDKPFAPCPGGGGQRFAFAPTLTMEPGSLVSDVSLQYTDTDTGHGNNKQKFVYLALSVKKINSAYTAKARNANR
jgi:hypothetical protein